MPKSHFGKSLDNNEDSLNFRWRKEDLRSLRQEGFSLGVSLVISYQRHLMDFDNRLDKSFGWLLWLGLAWREKLEMVMT